MTLEAITFKALFLPSSVKIGDFSLKFKIGFPTELTFFKFWCGEWDSNPRRPSPQGPKPCAFNLTWRPPQLLISFLTTLLTFFWA